MTIKRSNLLTTTLAKQYWVPIQSDIYLFICRDFIYKMYCVIFFHWLFEISNVCAAPCVVLEVRVSVLGRERVFSVQHVTTDSPFVLFTGKYVLRRKISSVFGERERFFFVLETRRKNHLKTNANTIIPMLALKPGNVSRDLRMRERMIFLVARKIFESRADVHRKCKNNCSRSSVNVIRWKHHTRNTALSEVSVITIVKVCNIITL